VALLTPLTEDERATFIVVALPDTVLRKLVGRLGTAAKGTRLDALSVWELADTLVDYYATDAEVVAELDRSLRRELGASPLAPAVAADAGGAAITNLVMDSRDPARDLAWALLGADRDEDRALATRLVQSIIAEFDQADERAKAETGKPKNDSAVVREAAKVAKRAEKDAARAESQRERALDRVDDLRARIVELERSIAVARKELRESERGRERATSERDKLAKEAQGLRARLQSGTAAEVVRLGEELDAAERQTRALESDLDEARTREDALAARVRTLEQAGPARAAAPEPSEAASPGGTWNVPIFTSEFYDSIRRWDRRIIRTTFEKVARLCEDWRHPSLRAIALEGAPEYYRIRIATDVRLIYRLADQNRIEILSLIDREDLQRYVRHVKGT
jgi:mRNA-degrading endonuclease RelE of RelBE toxin-antitoxin system